jgi:hypothetical protein
LEGRRYRDEVEEEMGRGMAVGWTNERNGKGIWE